MEKMKPTTQFLTTDQPLVIHQTRIVRVFPSQPEPAVNPNPNACPDCGALFEHRKDGKPRKCRCHRYEKKWNRPKRDGRPYEKALQAAHHYHLHRTIDSGSWSKTGHRPAKRTSYSHPLVQPGPDQRALADFLFRAELAASRWRDEFAGLMLTRVTLRLQGMTNPDVLGWLDLSRSELAELDTVISEYLPNRRSWRFGGRIRPISRKMKRGVAQDILRRRRMGIYNPAKVLRPQRVNPFTPLTAP